MATESIEHLIGFSNFINVFGGIALFGCALLFIFYYAGTFHVGTKDEQNDKKQMLSEQAKLASRNMGHGSNYHEDEDSVLNRANRRKYRFNQRHR